MGRFNSKPLTHDSVTQHDDIRVMRTPANKLVNSLANIDLWTL